MSDDRLTDREKRMGWVAYCCPVHGFLCKASAKVTVICGHRDPKLCRRRAEGWRGENKVKTGRMVEPKKWSRS